MSKRVKSSQIQKKEGKKARSTRADMCKRYDKERNRHYYARRKVRIQRGDTGLSPAEISKLAKKERELNDKIAVLSSKMFKCGNRYQKLLKKKRLLKSKEKRLLEQYKIDYSKMLSHQRSEAVRKIEKVSREIEDIEAVLNMPLKDRVKDSTDKMMQVQYADFEEDDIGDSISETFGVWELTDVVSDKVRSGLFSYISINGVVFNIENQSFEVFRYCQDVQESIDSSRKSSGSGLVDYKFNMVVNLSKKTVKIWQ